MLRTILLGAGVFAALLSILIFSGKIPLGDKSSQATGEVVIWGTIDDAAMNRILSEYNPKVKTFRASYKQIPEAQFNQTLLEALANGTGPDLIMVPHQYILANASRLYPFPSSSLTQKAYNDLYVDGGSVFLVPQGALALPVSIDPLVLYYNRTILSQHGIANPPQYWDELVNMVPKLTISRNGQFDLSAISLGAPNTPHGKEILMSTVLQLGQLPVFTQYSATDGSSQQLVLANNPTTTDGTILPLTTAARFFSQFADPTKNTYTWSQFGGDALDQFVALKSAMYIGYASEYATLQAKNPTADIQLATLPQTRGYNTFAMTGEMYGIATLKTSNNLVTALTVESQFASPGIAPALSGLVGALPALRSYASTQGLSEVLAKSMLVARPWYDSFPTQSESLIETMMGDIISGRMGAADAAATFVSRLQDLYTPI